MTIHQQLVQMQSQLAMQAMIDTYIVIGMGLLLGIMIIATRCKRR